MKTAKLHLTTQWQHTLSDYVTAVSWSPKSDWSAAATAAGEVILFSPGGEVMPIQNGEGQAVNCLGFSADGSFFAWGGQSGKLSVWQLREVDELFQQVHSGIWIDTLAWHPTLPLLAFGVGSNLHIWDAKAQQAIAQLDFEASSVLHVAWHPAGERLAASGHGGVKVWSTEDWATPPKLVAVPGASLHCAWSADGRYLGSGNLDRTLTVAEWDSPPPWLMQGFPGKVRQVAWSTVNTASGAPLIAAACVEGITVWERSDRPQAGWQSHVLQHHQQRVNAIAFQPHTLTLASAGQDGRIALWRNGSKLDQSLQQFTEGVSHLAWSPEGNGLLAGGNAGEIAVWQVSQRAQGFG